MRNFQSLFLVLIAVLLVSVVTIFPKNSFALPLEIQVLETQFTTFVHTSWSAIDPNDVSVVKSRTKYSSYPISDYLYGEISLGTMTFSAEAEAIADFFEVSVFGITKLWSSLASAKTEIIFTPLIDGLQSLSIDFAGYYDYFFSEGSVSLFDLTENQELWNYSWDHWFAGNVPWELVAGDVPGLTAVATLSLDTYFAADHTYTLKMFAGMDSNSDAELIKIKLTGLKIVSVPEPSTFILLCLGFLGLVSLKGKFRKNNFN